MLLLVFILVAGTQAVPPAPPPTIFRDRPPGHCDPICSCQINGLYYSEGERWTQPEHPCTVYQCLNDGVSDAVQKGCLYKGACHPVNATWSEGCSTFSCKESIFGIHYKLVEAGCPVATGACVKVGARHDIGCDVMECMLDGDVLRLTKIRTGCAVEGSCKRMNSYWHDGCTVYVCANETDTGVARALANEVMQWPEGQYAMLKPLTGCPSDIPDAWKEGSRTHVGAGRNFYSELLSLAGNYTIESMKHDFCVHGSTIGVAQLPEYKTFWEPGSYCILRRSGKCPRGFLDGYVSFDDNDARSQSTNTGTLPDGNYTRNTGLYFCCRKDGSVLSDIVLPKDESFVLFMNSGETGCQSVRGMSSSAEFFSFDGILTSKHEKRGHAPSVNIAEGDLKLNLCHYKPMKCGCSEKSGVFIAVNTEREIRCVVKKCISENGLNVLKIVSGGCPVGGKCQKEGTNWSLKQGDSCRRKSCTRVVVDTTTQFEIRDGFPGCLDGDVCQDVGTEIVRGCYTSRCTVEPVTNTLSFNVVSADCPWLDSCKAPNSTWKQNCMTYRCDVTADAGNYQWNIQPIQYACEWNNTCYNKDDVWSDGCIDYKCIVTRKAEEVNWSVKTVRIACKDLKGNCLAVGKEVVEKCVTYKCKLSGDRVGLTPISVGCDWNQTCIPENETWNDTTNCVDYQCQKKTLRHESVMQVSVIGYGCVFNNTCMAVNSTWPDGCRTRKCVVHKTKQSIQRSIAPTSAACDDEGTCREVGYKKTTSMCMEYECIFNETFNDSFFSLSKGACRSRDGKCHNVGTRWTEVQASVCLYYECRKEPIGYLSKMIEQKCVDSKGNCQAVGSSAFQAMVQGKLRKHCSCVASTTNVPGIAIRCKG